MPVRTLGAERIRESQKRQEKFTKIQDQIDKSVTTESDQTPQKACPFCGAANQLSAEYCKDCNTWLPT